jgi:hypothetical protein
LQVELRKLAAKIIQVAGLALDSADVTKTTIVHRCYRLVFLDLEQTPKLVFVTTVFVAVMAQLELNL